MSAGDSRGQQGVPRETPGQGQGNGPGDSRDTYRKSWSAPELMKVTFPDQRWAVPGILAEGVALCAGPPKVGKSWLVAGLVVATASGGVALGSVVVKQGPALYLALEDTGRRLQSRLRMVLAGDDAPAALTLVTECEGGARKVICDWLDHNPDARLVAIDVLARIRGPRQPGQSVYEADYRAVTQIKSIADQYKVPFLVVHHTRKAAADDFLDEVSGSQGVAGAADSVLVLKRIRGQADGILHVTGRDIEEVSLALNFDKQTGSWSLSDVPASEAMLTETRARIMAYIREHAASQPKEISGALKLNHELVKKTCKRMSDDAQLDTDGRGSYFVPGVPLVPPVVPVPSVPAVPRPAQGQGNAGTDHFPIVSRLRQGRPKVFDEAAAIEASGLGRPPAGAGYRAVKRLEFARAHGIPYDSVGDCRECRKPAPYPARLCSRHAGGV